MPDLPRHFGGQADIGFYPILQPSQCAPVTWFPHIPGFRLLRNFH